MWLSQFLLGFKKRNVDHILTNTLLPEMSKELLSRMAAGEHLKEVKVSLCGDAFGFEIS